MIALTRRDLLKALLAAPVLTVPAFAVLGNKHDRYGCFRFRITQALGGGPLTMGTRGSETISRSFPFRVAFIKHGGATEVKAMEDCIAKFDGTAAVDSLSFGMTDWQLNRFHAWTDLRSQWTVKDGNTLLASRGDTLTVLGEVNG